MFCVASQSSIGSCRSARAPLVLPRPPPQRLAAGDFLHPALDVGHPLLELGPAHLAQDAERGEQRIDLVVIPGLNPGDVILLLVEILLAPRRRRGSPGGQLGGLVRPLAADDRVLHLHVVARPILGEDTHLAVEDTAAGRRDPCRIHQRPLGLLAEGRSLNHGQPGHLNRQARADGDGGEHEKP